jgi:hypothetical protein
VKDSASELNRILLAVNALKDNKKSAYVRAVVRSCRETVIDSTLPNHDSNIAFTTQLGFLSRKNKKVALTPEGESFLEFNPDGLYELTEDQKRLLLRNCYLHGALRTVTFRVMKRFSAQYEKANTFRWSPYDGDPMGEDEWMLRHLEELGLISQQRHYFEVQAEYVTTVGSFLSEGKGWSEEELREYLEQKKEVGDVAEDLILTFEIDRLRKLGCEVECRCVRRISKVRVNAGYDLESFNGKSKDLNFDRVIEVKGSAEKGLRFFWSNNEIEVAKSLGDKYWIYYLGGVNRKAKAATEKPIQIQNPVKAILEKKDFKTTPQGVIVEKNAS